jgi:Fe-S-cluster containining protein
MELSPALARLAPELLDVDLSEPMAPCAHCVMAPRSGDPPERIRFTAAARCCTYHPKLANFLVGAALRDGGPGAAAIRRRLADLEGVGRLGIAPQPRTSVRYRERSADSFGRDDALTCPYWAEGPLGCTIHPHRNAICRTWSCRSTHGARGATAFQAVKHLLYDLEHVVAELVASDTHTGWESYFLECAERADALDVGSVRGPRLDALMHAVREAVAQRDRPLPLCPTPALRAWHTFEDRVVLESWSPYDPVTVPPWIFQLLSRLDGETPWPEALAATEAVVGTTLSADLVANLWWRGLLAAPEDDEGYAIDVLPND